MSLVANYASDSDEASASEEETVVPSPLTTSGSGRRGLAAFLPPPKGSCAPNISDAPTTLTVANDSKEREKSEKNKGQEKGQTRKVRIVVSLPDRHALSDEEDEDEDDEVMKKDSTQTAASSMGNGGLRSSLSSFLPPPRNRRPMKSTAGLGERAGSNARDWSGTAMGADAHIPDEINGMQQPDDGQDVSGSSTAMPTLNAMIPHSLMKRQQKPSSSTVKSKGKDVEETNLFPLAIEESESREYSRDSISATIKPITASIDTAEQNTYDASAYQYQEYAYTQGYDMHNVSQTYEDDGQMTLSDEAIAALTGRRKRQHDFGPVNVNIVDVNLADRMSGPGYGGIGNPDKLAQQAAMQMTPIGGGGDKRRRHNIMYLAQQAASREQEFEERAAIGRKNRRETAAKYGFR